MREYLNKTAGDFNLYSPLEQESLKAAAALLAAKVPGNIPVTDMGRADVARLALMNLLHRTAEHTPLSFENWFLGLATIALQVASDACVKKTLNIVAQGFKVPAVTTEESVDLLLSDLRHALKMFLLQAGRRLETPRLIQDVHGAVRQLKEKEPNKKVTQQNVAEILGIDPRTLRKRQTAYGIETWDELLLACEYWEELNVT
ncbi:MAG: hypothetical protein ACJ74W_19720 [Pyrinomonadaceae bacterium]